MFQMEPETAVLKAYEEFCRSHGAILRLVYAPESGWSANVRKGDTVILDTIKPDPEKKVLGFGLRFVQLGRLLSSRLGGFDLNRRSVFASPEPADVKWLERIVVNNEFARKPTRVSCFFVPEKGWCVEIIYATGESVSNVPGLGSPGAQYRNVSSDNEARKSAVKFHDAVIDVRDAIPTAMGK